MSGKDLLWGIDLGGTKVELAVIRPGSDLDIIWRERISTGAEGGYENILGQINKLIRQAEEELGIKAIQIGMGTPGSLGLDGKLKNSNTTVLNGKSLLRDIEDKTGVSFKIANDANCFALAETLYGSVQEQCPNAEVVFGIIMGTGVGGGLVVNGKVINGLHGIGGEWGHHYLVPDGKKCYCGRKGCTEQYISGPATEAFYRELTDKTRKLKEISQLAKAGDAYAVQTIDRLCVYFSKAVSNIINIIDPDAIVLGGGVGNIEDLYEKGVKLTESHIFNPHLETKFLKPKLGDSAGVIGAAFL